MKSFPSSSNRYNRQNRYNRHWSLQFLEPRIMLAGDVGTAMECTAVTTQCNAKASVEASATVETSGLVFVAPDVPDLESLLAGMDPQHELILLSDSRPVIDQISDTLHTRSGVASIHLITHGDSGEILVGGQSVTLQTLVQSQQQIRQWRSSLAAGADVLIYGCNVGSGDRGQSFVDFLARLSGADVAASIDFTGARSRGGDWDLERSVGLVESSLAINSTTLNQFAGVLPISIRAAGVQNDEQMLLQVNGQTVATFNNVGGDAYAGVFQTYIYNVDGVDVNDVRVVFTNDAYNPATGYDRNLRVDQITIDGVVFQTEDPTTFSTGTYLPTQGIVPGTWQSEYLHYNGYFQFAGSPASTVIKINARGEEGKESFALQIDGQDVATWNNIGTQLNTFTFVVDGSITGSNVRIAFLNDLHLPTQGIDRNLIVDSIEIDGVVYQTEDPTTFSTGTYVPGEGIVPGFRQSEYLHGNGYFQFADPPLSTVIKINAIGEDGDESFSLQIDGQDVATWNNIGTEAKTYTFVADGLVTASDVRIAFLNDRFLPAQGIDRNLIIDSIEIDDIVYQTEDPEVYSTGTWLPADGITPGFRLSEKLHTNGYFQYTVGQPTVPNGSGFTTETLASGLNQAISFAVAPDGRIFVAEKPGVIRVIQNGQVLATPFLDINEQVNSHHDRGMLGIALDPDFANNGYVYVQYSVELNPTNPDEVNFNSPAGGELIRIKASATNPNIADLSTRVVVLDGHYSEDAAHSVGDVDFDNAGNLIFTWGDGGFEPYLREATQNPNSVQGKLFRVDPVTFQGVPGNPFYDPAQPNSVASKVWAVGIRNSWKFSVDRLTGDVYLGEVTDLGPEEINVLRADGTTQLNYGWPYYEGDNRTEYGILPPNFTYQSAFIELAHTGLGGGDALLGGALYRGDVYPDIYDGRYFFGNFNQGILYSADVTGNFQPFGAAGDYAGVTDLQVGPDGHLWVMSIFTGSIERLIYTGGGGNIDPVAQATTDTTAGVGPLVVNLDASTSTDGDGDTLSYTWDFESDGVIDAIGATATHTYAVVGRTNTTLTVSDGNGGIDSRIIEIDVLASAPADGNLALGKPTSQSETDDGAISSRAVDGNTSGVFTTNSVAQTLPNRTPFWEIDLGAIYNIGTIELFTRTDGVNPLQNYFVFVSQNPFSSGNLDAVQNDPGIWFTSDLGTADPFESIAVGTLGRYVRVQMASVEDVLALAEVKVFEVALGGV